MKKLRILPLGRSARTLIRIALPLITVTSVALLLSYLEARAKDPVGANYYYPQLLEYIIASIVITAGGALLIELAEREKR